MFCNFMQINLYFFCEMYYSCMLICNLLLCKRSYSAGYCKLKLNIFVQKPWSLNLRIQNGYQITLIQWNPFMKISKGNDKYVILSKIQYVIQSILQKINNLLFCYVRLGFLLVYIQYVIILIEKNTAHYRKILYIISTLCIFIFYFLYKQSAFALTNRNNKSATYNAVGNGFSST